MCSFVSRLAVWASPPDLFYLLANRRRVQEGPMNTQHHLQPVAVTVLFEPTRLAPACLQDAYRLLLPLPRHLTESCPPAPAPPTFTEQREAPHESLANSTLRPGIV